MSEKTYSLELTIRTLLANKRYSSIKDILITLNAADIAAIFAVSLHDLSSRATAVKHATEK
jgi:magnesium transporter